MNVMIFSLTILIIYGIMVYSYKAWKRASLKDAIGRAEETEEMCQIVREFKKSHKGNTKKQKKEINKFIKESK